VLVGASRKTFLGKLLAAPDGTVRPAEQRDDATLATTVMAAQAGVWGVRVHDAAASVDAVRIVEAVRAVRG
jgi:dihydropteroate synthase